MWAACWPVPEARSRTLSVGGREWRQDRWKNKSYRGNTTPGASSTGRVLVGCRGLGTRQVRRRWQPCCDPPTWRRAESHRRLLRPTRMNRVVENANSGVSKKKKKKKKGGRPRCSQTKQMGTYRGRVHPRPTHPPGRRRLCRLGAHAGKTHNLMIGEGRTENEFT